MTHGEIDRIQVNQLSDRYDGLAKSAIYTRMEALKIKPERIGNRSYVNAQQLQLLDALHEFINSGGTTAEFLESRGLNKPQDGMEGLSSGLSTGQPDLVRLVTAIASEIVSRVQPQRPDPNPFAYYQMLEDAYRNGWLLSTSEIADLLDLSPAEMRHYGDSFSEAGFVFTKAGYRAGGEVAWKVSKPLR
jgi:hypothetical protein